METSSDTGVFENGIYPKKPVWNLKKGGRALFEKKKDAYDFAIQSAENQCAGRRILLLGTREDGQTFEAHGIGEYQRVESEAAFLDEIRKAPAYGILCQELKEEGPLWDLGWKDYQDYFVLSRSAEYVKRLLYRPLTKEEEAAPICIMTNSSAGLMPTIFTQIEELYENMPERQIKCYIFHSSDAREAFESLRRASEVFPNIELISVIPPNEAIYDEFCSIASWGGRQWPKNVFYWICAHLYLPETMDRVFYFNAGDVMFDGDLAPFYFDDFEGNALLAGGMDWPQNFCKEISPSGEVVRFSQEDFWNSDSLDRINGLLVGGFNASSILINLDYMREHGYTEQTYIDFVHRINEKFPEAHILAEQGLMSVFFQDHTKFYGLKVFQDAWFRPFNLQNFYFSFTEGVEPYYDVAIFHFTSPDKPWVADVANTFILSKEEPRWGLASYTERNQRFYDKWYGYYLRGQLRLNARSYLMQQHQRHVENLNLRNRLFLEAIEMHLAALYPMHLRTVNGGFWLQISLSADGALHYEVLCHWGPPSICLHFENDWNQRPEKEILSKQAVAADRKDALSVSLLTDGLGCFYQLPSYDTKSAILYLRRLIDITLPLLRQTGLVDDECYLMLQ